jgi:hypothetical protein
MSAKLSVHNIFQVGYRPRCAVLLIERILFSNFVVERIRGPVKIPTALLISSFYTYDKLVTLRVYLTTPERVSRPL